MSRDIRSFFTKVPKDAGPSKKPKPKAVLQISSDEEDTKTKSPNNQKKASKKSIRRHALSDSDDEAPIAKKKVDKVVAEKVKEEKLTPVTINEVFKKKGIKRVHAAAIVSKELQKKEAEFHDDDEFEATLNQLDISSLESGFESAPTEDNSNGKRKHSGDSEEDVKAKKKRLDESRDEKTSTNREKERKESSEDENKKKSPKTETTSTESNDEKKSTKREKESSDDGNKKKSPKTDATSTESSGEKKSSKREKESSEDRNKKKSPKTESISKRDSSASRKTDIKDESNSVKSSSSSNKLQFNRINKNKKADIVFEPKVEQKKEKKKKNENTGEAADQYADGIEKKKERAVLYNKYLQRGGARNPGSKPIPEGADNCLAGLTFLITGVLESLERDEADELIKKYGGRVVAAVSKKTDYLVVGDDAGPSKLAKAENFGIKQISEDELLDIIRTKPAGKAKNIVQPRNSTNKKRSRSPEKLPSSPSPPKSAKTAPEIKTADVPSTSIENPESKETNSASTSGNTSKLFDSSKDEALPQAQALVDKYRPKAMKQIIGQHGDKSNANKLHTWLSNWYKNQSGDVKLTKPSPWAKNDDGAFFKACLLSGPPGVGKTTTAQVVCAELEFDLLEFNASDTRSKRLLKEEVAGILSNTTVKGYFTGDLKHKLTKKHALLMDEVDGMAGNEDRGGLQELIALIKSSEVPVICICNDRNHPKMRTLANYTFDLRFQKPRLEQIRGAMKSLCHKEKIVISTEDLDRLIESTNQDIRQIINHLAMLSRGSTSHEKTNGKNINKDLRLGPWDVVQKVFSADEHAKMNIHDKSALFFHDYNIAGLFVQENYLSVQPKAPKNELLKRVAQAADSLAIGDVIENAIRGSSAWSLLPTQACFSSVIPGTLMSGRMTARANFPAWLGRNSKRGKFDRLLQEITVHARLATGASKEAINIDYLPHLRDAVVRPLSLRKNEGIDESLNVMNNYHLLREDLESLMEVSLWPGQSDPLQAIESKVKAAFTRAYNKSSAPTPYITNAAAPKKKNAQASQDEEYMAGEEEEDAGASDNDDNDDMESDRMIKAKKATVNNKTAGSSKTEAKPKASNRGRGRGRGKAK